MFTSKTKISARVQNLLFKRTTKWGNMIQIDPTKRSFLKCGISHFELWNRVFSPIRVVKL